jgi:hypothetical protein
MQRLIESHEILIISHVIVGDVNGCVCISEFSTEPGGGKRAPKTHDNGVAFQFEDEVLVHRANVEKTKAEIR